MAKVFLPLADMLDIIQAIPLCTIEPTSLRASVETFYQAIRGAGWAAKSHSKFHWLIHFPKHLEKHKMLPGCLVQERKHRLVKRFAADIQNTRQYENSLLKQVLAHDIADFEDSSWVSPPWPPCAAQASTANEEGGGGLENIPAARASWMHRFHSRKSASRNRSKRRLCGIES